MLSSDLMSNSTVIVDFKMLKYTMSLLNRGFKCDFKKFMTGYLDLE